MIKVSSSQYDVLLFKVSKNVSRAELLLQKITCIQWLQIRGGENRTNKHFLSRTEPENLRTALCASVPSLFYSGICQAPTPVFPAFKFLISDHRSPKNDVPNVFSAMVYLWLGCFGV